MIVTLKGRRIVGGNAKGKAVVSKEPISFYGGIDPKSGKVIEKGHEIEGESVAGRILVFPQGKGSTVGCYTIYSMAKKKRAPSAIINVEADPVIAVGCCLAKIPLVDKLDKNPLEIIETGDFVEVIADQGLVKVKKARKEGCM